MLIRWKVMRPALAKAGKEGGGARCSAVVNVMPVTNKQRRRKRPKGGVATLKSRRLLATVVLTMLAAAVVLALPATAAPKPLATLRANLTTEVPGPGDPNGHGHAHGRILSPPAQAHLQRLRGDKQQAKHEAMA
jgi:hypothetical protein